jgi:hypothetical protein
VTLQSDWAFIALRAATRGVRSNENPGIAAGVSFSLIAGLIVRHSGARQAPSPESIHPKSQADICGYKSIHCGLRCSISRIFQSRRHFNSFSRVIAVTGSS